LDTQARDGAVYQATLTPMADAILANQHADAVFAAVEKLLRVQLGGNLTIEKNITLAPGAPQPDLTLSGHGEGSRDALQQPRMGCTIRLSTFWRTCSWVVNPIALANHSALVETGGDI
jgi:hypothetical protein